MLAAAALTLPRNHGFGAVLTAGAVVGTALLGWWCVAVNLDRGCTQQDTPYFDLCRADPLRPQALRARIQGNPGESMAYVRLALSDPTGDRGGLMKAAARLAPHDPNILGAQAAFALAQRDWPGAAGPLVQLSEQRSSDAAELALAALIAGGHGEVLLPYLTPGSQWFPRTLAKLTQQPSSTAVALPLVAQALKAGVLDAGAVRLYSRKLKASGEWADAYSLWVHVHGKPLPLIYNGGFDQTFQPDGFDWEVPASGPVSRAGAIVERRNAEQRGAVLDIRFTGRAISLPVVRQNLFLGPGRYRLRGDYMASQLRIEHGLAWRLSCEFANVAAGNSPALADTGGSWQAFFFEFTVPPACGLIAGLQLQTHDPLDAAIGGRGRVAFDAFTLEKLPL